MRKIRQSYDTLSKKSKCYNFHYVERFNRNAFSVVPSTILAFFLLGSSFQEDGMHEMISKYFNDDVY